MNPITSLANQALLGLDRRSPEWPVLEGPIGELLDRIPRDSSEKALLRSAGILATCRIAGNLPPKVENAPPPASEESTPEDPRIDLLGAILAEGPERLQAEAFHIIAAHGRHLPHRLLPSALECGRRCSALRPALLAALGKTGEWLAAKNEAWSYAAGRETPGSDATDVWSHGSPDQRQIFLVDLRRRNPEKARELISEAMKSEGARERCALLETLSAGLSLDDEALLEAILTDKSKEARQLAGRLLSRLPESRFSRRMAGLVAPLLKVEKKLLRGTVITLEAPVFFDPAWKTDLIEEAKPKGLGLGDRAWWLFQMVRHTSLSWWETETGMSPADCLRWAQKLDWKEALLLGWAEAQAMQRRMEWAEAFLDFPLPSNGPLSVFDLLETLPLRQREVHFLNLLAGNHKTSFATSTLLDRFIKTLSFEEGTLTSGTAGKAARLLKQQIHSGQVRNDWPLRQSLVEFACIIPRESFDEFALGWNLAKEEVQPFSDAVSRVGIVLDQRTRLNS